MPEPSAPNLHADDKQSAIHEMVDALCEAGKIAGDEVEGIVKAILKREELGSTGIGRGVAVPHTKHVSVQRLVGTVAVSPEGIDFNSLDGEKVNLFFLLISPRTGRGTICGHWRIFRVNFATTRSASFSNRRNPPTTSGNCWRKPTTTGFFRGSPGLLLSSGR